MFRNSFSSLFGKVKKSSKVLFGVPEIFLQVLKKSKKKSVIGFESLNNLLLSFL